MAQRTTVNQKRGDITIISDATGYLNLNGGTNPSNAAGETVTSMAIDEVLWSLSVATNSWSIGRGGNTSFICYGHSGHHKFKDTGLRLESGGDSVANTFFTLSGGSGRLILKLHKQSGE
jgi:hypothetical protein